jgi:hypothetical protein
VDVDSGLLGVEESLQMLAKLTAAEEKALKDALEFILREMANYVKKNGPWTDRTSNLRNSISVNMDTMKEWPADTPAATLQALVSENETPIIKIEGNDYVGCLSAGMEYSLFVEIKGGFWVLQGALDWMSPKIEQLFAGKLSVDNFDLEEMATIAYLKYQTRQQFGR